MFLTTLSLTTVSLTKRALRKLSQHSTTRPRLRDERGGAMVAVLGIMAVTSIIGVTITASTVNALSFTSATRAAVQARAAAEAGIDRALVDLQSACVATSVSTVAPRFSYALQYTLAGTPVWRVGCPPVNAEFIKIRSTGYASALGVAGASSGDSRVLEAIYSYIPVYVELPQIEPALYAHTLQGSLQSFVLTSANNSISADILIKNGNVVCSNGATIDGSIVLSNGYVDLTNCNVNGSIHASKYVRASGNNTTVLGDIIAVGDGVAAGGNAVSLLAGSTVRGKIYSGNSVLVDARAEGNVTAAGTSTSAVRVERTGRVVGDVVSSGPVTVASGGIVNGTISTSVTGLAAVPAPRVPNWTDIGYPSSSWNGYTVVDWQGSCTVGNVHAFWDSLATRTATSGNIVVNALNVCGAAGLNFQNNIRSIVLSANISFVAQNFFVDKLVVTSNNSTTRNLWFVVPDNVADGQPTPYSTGNCDITLTNEADIAPTIAAFVYTPCKIISDRNHWRGQLYGGSMEFLQQAQLTFVMVGVPGVNFNASLPPVLQLDRAVLGDRVSLREPGSGG